MYESRVLMHRTRSTLFLTTSPHFPPSCSYLESLSTAEAVCVAFDTHPAYWNIERVRARSDATSMVAICSMSSHVNPVTLDQTCLTGSFAAVPVHHLLEFFRSVEQNSPRVVGVWHRRCHAVNVSKMLLPSQKWSAEVAY